MANYPTASITKQGMDLYAKVQAGVTLHFTRMQIGAGQLELGQDVTMLTALISPIMHIPLLSITRANSIANIKAMLDNSAVITPTYTCELGLFATDPDLGEILYFYSNAGEEGDTIPPLTSGPFSRQFQISASIGNAENVTIVMPANAYIPWIEKGAVGGVALYDTLDSHMHDNIRHITATERAKWNANINKTINLKRKLRMGARV